MHKQGKALETTAIANAMINVTKMVLAERKHPEMLLVLVCIALEQSKQNYR